MHAYPHPQRAPHPGMRVGCVGRGIGSGTNIGIGIGIRVLFYEGLDFWIHVGSFFYSSFVSFVFAYLCSNRMMMMGYFFDTSPTDPSPFSSTFLDSD
jgi:hypothetical protein